MSYEFLLLIACLTFPAVEAHRRRVPGIGGSSEDKSLRPESEFQPFSTLFK